MPTGETAHVGDDRLDFVLRRSHDLPDRAKRAIAVIDRRQADETTDAHRLEKRRRMRRRADRKTNPQSKRRIRRLRSLVNNATRLCEPRVLANEILRS